MAPSGSVTDTLGDSVCAPLPHDVLVSADPCQVPLPLAAEAEPRQDTETLVMGKVDVNDVFGVNTKLDTPERVAPDVGVVSVPGVPLATWRV